MVGMLGMPGSVLLHLWYFPMLLSSDVCWECRCSLWSWLEVSLGFSQIKSLFTALFLRRNLRDMFSLLVNMYPQAPLWQLSNWDYAPLTDLMLNGLQTTSCVLHRRSQSFGIGLRYMRKWKEGKKKKKKILLCFLNCAYFVNDWHLCLSPQVSTCHWCSVVSRKLGTKSENEWLCHAEKVQF